MIRRRIGVLLRTGQRMSPEVPWPLLGMAMLSCTTAACPRRAVGMAPGVSDADFACSTRAARSATPHRGRRLLPQVSLTSITDGASGAIRADQFFT